MKIGINFAFLKDYFRNYAIRQEIVFAKIIGIFSNNAQKRKSTDQVSIGLKCKIKTMQFHEKYLIIHRN